MIDESASGRQFPWRRRFAAAITPVFVASAQRRIRYANPAFERLTGKSESAWRGMRLSALLSASELGQALAVPPEVWRGEPAHVRRPAPGSTTGPPWWDVQFCPLLGTNGPLAVIGLILVREPEPEHALAPIPAELGTARARLATAFGWSLWQQPSAGMQRLLARAQFAATVTAPVWVRGGPGAGKHTLARTLHHHGPHRERAFVRLDGTAVPPYLVEAQLFGKGGLANSPQVGTVYLADPAAWPRDLQERVLAWVDSRTGPRLICGADRAAADLVSTGLSPTFDARFSVIELTIPPLGNRPVDLPHYVRHWSSRVGHTGGCEPSALDSLTAHDWPGNVRELFDVLESARPAAGGGSIRRDHWPRFLQERHLLKFAPTDRMPRLTLKELLEAVERRQLQLALAVGGSHEAAARRLGLSRAAFGRRLVALGLTSGGG